jgi:hypothetical protein
MTFGVLAHSILAQSFFLAQNSPKWAKFFWAKFFWANFFGLNFFWAKFFFFGQNFLG